MKIMKLMTIKNLHIVSIIGVLTVYLVAAVSYIENDTAYINLLNHQYEIGKCMYKEQIGISCPSCGLTRSFITIMHMDMKHLFVYNYLGVFVFLASIILVIFNLLSLKNNKYAPKVGNFLAIYGVSLAILLAIVWGIKVVIFKQID